MTLDLSHDWEERREDRANTRTGIFLVTFTFQPNSWEVLPSTSFFGTSRDHRCLPFYPPGTCLYFLSRVGFSFPIARRLSSRVASTGDHSNWDQILSVKIAKYTGFCVYRRSYLIWPPAILIVSYTNYLVTDQRD